MKPGLFVGIAPAVDGRAVTERVAAVGPDRAVPPEVAEAR